MRTQTDYQREYRRRKAQEHTAHTETMQTIRVSLGLALHLCSATSTLYTLRWIDRGSDHLSHAAYLNRMRIGLETLLTTAAGWSADPFAVTDPLLLESLQSMVQ